MDERFVGGVSSAVFLSVVIGVKLGLGFGLILNCSKLVAEADNLPSMVKSTGVRLIRYLPNGVWKDLFVLLSDISLYDDSSSY